ncbi:hypothetical protein [Neobacillus soli]|nr:hypothetical protein [Neobacillus soli]
MMISAVLSLVGVKGIAVFVLMLLAGMIVILGTALKRNKVKEVVSDSRNM